MDATALTSPEKEGAPAQVADGGGPIHRLFGDDDGELERALGSLSGETSGSLRCQVVVDVVDLDGRCDAADTVVDPESGERRAAQRVASDDEYSTPIRLAGSRFQENPSLSFTFVRVRSDAAWFIDQMGNVLGTASTGVCVRAEGPLKNPGLGNAMGYAIRVRDKTGRVCRGYVSATVVDEHEPALR